MSVRRTVFPGGSRQGDHMTTNRARTGSLPGLVTALVVVLAVSLGAEQVPRGLQERADRGDPQAQTELGSRYYAGRGVPQDDAAAVRWTRLAAEQGHAPAQYNLGLLYFRSRGVLGDDAEAARWYRAAAEQGYAPGQGGLGYMYAYGAGVERDPVRAYMWLELARTGADSDFTRELYARQRDELASEMTAEQVGEAQRLAREWTPAPER